MTNPKQIVPPAQLTVAAATYYTAPANTKCLIKKLTFTNTSAAAVQVTVYLVPLGGTAGDANTIRKTKTIAPAPDIFECYEAENHVLEEGGAILASASAGVSVTIMASGIELT